MISIISLWGASPPPFLFDLGNIISLFIVSNRFLPSTFTSFLINRQIISNCVMTNLIISVMTNNVTILKIIFITINMVINMTIIMAMITTTITTIVMVRCETRVNVL